MNMVLISKKRQWPIWLLLITVLFFVASQGASAETSYTVNLAGHTFDPKVTSSLPTKMRLSKQDETEYSQRENYYLVQLQNTLTSKSRTQLQSQYGLTLQEYIPELTYLEKLSPGTLKSLSQDKLIRAIIPFQPAFKVSPNIGKLKFRTKERKEMSGVMVRILLFKDADPDSVKNALSELKATEIETSDQRKYGGVAYRANPG